MRKIILVNLIALCFFSFVYLIGATGAQTPQVTTSTTSTPKVTPTLSPCRKYSKVVGECFTFKGRYSFYNGNPSQRIWMIGTHRILGVCEQSCPDLDYLPKNIKDNFKDFNTEIYGYFTVCPIRPYEKGVMQFVCIDSVQITSVKQRE
jgi:hypothetical protein